MTEKNKIKEADIKEMQKKIKEIQEIIYGDSKEKSSLVYKIVSSIENKIDSENLKVVLNTLVIMGWVIIVLLLCVIAIVCIFQSQLVDVSELNNYI